MKNEPVDYPPLQAGGIIENNEPYGWHCFIGKGKEEQDFLFINGKGASKPDASWDKVIPLYTHPVTEHFEDEPQAEELHGILQSYNEPLNYEVTHPRWSKEKEMFASWEYPQKTYADGIEECAQRAEAYAYMSPNFTVLAEELRALLKKASEKRTGIGKKMPTNLKVNL